MPQFLLNASPHGRHCFYSLNTFAKGYVEAMFFTNGDIGDTEREDYLNKLGVERLTRDAVADIKADCAKFESDNAALLALAYARNYDEAQAGRDFWLSRQGHGAGYWDRQELNDGGLGDELHKATKPMGEAYPYVERGWIYHT